MVEFRPQANGEYKVHYENGVYMGDVSIAHDAVYNFWPELAHGGYWPAHVLREIVDFLDVLNKPIEDDFNKWCDEESKKVKDI